MLRGEADLGLPQLDCSRHTYSHRGAPRRPASAPLGKGGQHGKGGGGILGQQVSAYARVTLARLAAQVRKENNESTADLSCAAHRVDPRM